MGISEFCLKAQTELKISPTFQTENLEDIWKCRLFIGNLEFIGIGRLEKDSKMSCIGKAKKYLKWITN